MAKIGYLYLHGGEWSGRQLLPKDWVAKTFRPTVDMKIGTLRYANGWWTVPEKDAHMAVGFLRQLIVVLPKLDVVAVVTGRRHYPFDALIDRVAAAARATTALPADPEGSDRLARRVAAAAIEEPSAVGPASSLAASVGGRTYRFAPNPIGLRTMKLDLAPPNARYDITFGAAGSERPTRRFEGPLGLDGRFAIREARGDEPLLAVKGTWAVRQHLPDHGAIGPGRDRHRVFGVVLRAEYRCRARRQPRRPRAVAGRSGRVAIGATPRRAASRSCYCVPPSSCRCSNR